MSENTKMSILEDSEVCVVSEGSEVSEESEDSFAQWCQSVIRRARGFSVYEVSAVPTIDKTFCDVACFSLMWLWALVVGVIL